MQNFPFSARVLIHFIKWMSCSGWFHSPGYYYEGYLHVRPVSVSGNHAGCAVLCCSALLRAWRGRHCSFATLLYCHLYFPLAVAMLYVPISQDVFHLPATAIAIASASATEYAKWGCQWACNSQLILIRGHTYEHMQRRRLLALISIYLWHYYQAPVR